MPAPPQFGLDLLGASAVDPVVASTYPPPAQVRRISHGAPRRRKGEMSDSSSGRNASFAQRSASTSISSITSCNRSKSLGRNAASILFAMSRPPERTSVANCEIRWSGSIFCGAGSGAYRLPSLPSSPSRRGSADIEVFIFPVCGARLAVGPYGLGRLRNLRGCFELASNGGNGLVVDVGLLGDGPVRLRWLRLEHLGDQVAFLFNGQMTAVQVDGQDEGERIDRNRL